MHAHLHTYTHACTLTYIARQPCAREPPGRHVRHRSHPGAPICYISNGIIVVNIMINITLLNL